MSEELAYVILIPIKWFEFCVDLICRRYNRYITEQSTKSWIFYWYVETCRGIFRSVIFPWVRQISWQTFDNITQSAKLHLVSVDYAIRTRKLHQIHYEVLIKLQCSYQFVIELSKRKNAIRIFKSRRLHVSVNIS